MNATDLRAKSDQELRDELLALRREQFNLRMQKGINPDAVRSDQIGEVRRNIARVKTVMNEKSFNTTMSVTDYIGCHLRFLSETGLGVVLRLRLQHWFGF